MRESEADSKTVTVATRTQSGEAVIAAPNTTRPGAAALRDSAGGAIGLGALVGLAAGVVVAFSVGSGNRLSGSDWRGLTWLVGGSYVAAGTGLAAILTGLSRILTRLRPGSAARRQRPGASAVVVTAGFLAALSYGAAGSALERVGLTGGLVGAGRVVVFVAVLSVMLTLTGPLARPLASIARARVLAPAFVLVALIYVFTASATARRWTREAQEGETRFLEATRAQTADKQQRVLLIGLDGACWNYVEVMMQRGELPALSRLAAQGVAGPLRSFRPTQSPLIWTSMATGVAPSVHGVESFTAYRLPAVSDPILQLAPGTGFHRMLDLAEAGGIVHRQPVTARCCRKPRVWDILSGTGVPCAVMGWWATWPAAELNGIVVSDTFFYERHAARLGEQTGIASTGAVSPAALLRDLEPLRVRTSDLKNEEVRRFMDVSDEQLRRMHETSYSSDLLESEFLFLLAMDQTYRNVAVHLMKSAPQLRFVTVYLRGIDILGHAALRYGTPIDEPPAKGPFADTVRRYYIYADSMVQELIDAWGDDRTVIIVSDHGFEKQNDGVFGHDEAPNGVLFARGQPFLEGQRVDDATVYDIMPTLLHLYGLAVPEDGRGRPLIHLLSPAGAGEGAPRKIPTYGFHFAQPGEGAASSGDQEAVKRLRALGYLDKEGAEGDGD